MRSHETVEGNDLWKNIVLNLCTYCTPTNHFQATRTVFIELFRISYQGWGWHVWGKSQPTGVLSMLLALKKPQPWGMTTIYPKCVALRVIFEAFYSADCLWEELAFPVLPFPVSLKIFVASSKPWYSAVKGSWSSIPEPLLTTMWTWQCTWYLRL